MSGTFDLLGLSLEQLRDVCLAEGFPKYTATQICEWLYKKKVRSVDQMTNLSLVQRNRLKEISTINRKSPIYTQLSKDGTKKYLFDVGENALDTQSVNHYVETVYIPEDDRATLCVSCQVGCKMACRFCVTGKQGFHGNLTAGDILSQLFDIEEFDSLTNVVFMGMGEPLDNLDAVLATINVLTSPWGLGWSPKRVTVSTVGYLPGLRRILNETQCHLAVSLHNPVEEERLQIMPIQRTNSIKEVVSMLRRYDWSGQRRLSFEYTMFEGLNDDLEHGRKLVALLQGIVCRVNLIKFHTSPGTPFKPSSQSTMVAFRDYLNSHGITCTIRASRGQDIDAACGMLAGKNKRE